MPIPEGYLLAKAQFVVEDATGVRFWACNCGSQPANRTLRFVAANRGKFSLSPNPTQPNPTQPKP